MIVIIFLVFLPVLRLYNLIGIIMGRVCDIFYQMVLQSRVSMIFSTFLKLVQPIYDLMTIMICRGLFVTIIKIAL